jgi:hypothetical protein
MITLDQLKAGDRFIGCCDELDTDHEGNERTTPAGSVWIVCTGPWDEEAVSIFCEATGGWIMPTLAELNNPALFERVPN